MYTEDGITYVVGMEGEFMGYFLKYHKKKYKHIFKSEKATAEQRQRAKEREQLIKLKREERYAELNPKKEEEPKPVRVIIESPDAEELNQEKLKAYHREWYQQHREREIQKNKIRYRKIMAERCCTVRTYQRYNIPYASGTPEYARIYARIRRARKKLHETN